MKKINNTNIKLFCSELFSKNSKINKIIENAEFKVNLEKNIVDIVFKKNIFKEIFKKNCLDLLILNLKIENIFLNITLSLFVPNKIENTGLIVQENKKFEFLDNFIPADKNFGNFIETKFNSMAFSVIKNLNKKNNKNLNNIFLYSRSGLGKSHLLYGLYNSTSNKNKVVYLNLAFLIKENKDILKNLNELFDYLDNFEFLLIDDFQFLEKNKDINNFIFKIIEKFILKNKKIIVVADSPINLLINLENRIITRLESFISINIENPTPETILKIIRNKINKGLSNFKIEKGVLEYLADNFYENIRKIDGMVSIIIFNTINMDVNYISLNFIENLFKDKIVKSKSVDYFYIIEEISKHYNITELDIINKKNDKKINFCNNLIFYTLKNVYNYEIEQINILFSSKNPLNIKNGINKINKELLINKDLQMFIDIFKYKYYKKYNKE